MADEIIRNPPSRTQNSVLPSPLVYPDSLNRNPTPGIQSLNQTIKALSKRRVYRISYGTALEVWPPMGPAKTKYKLPHMNMADDKMLEDYLLKVRDPNYDEGVRINPEDFLIALQNLQPEANASSFFGYNEKTPEQKIALKNYYDAVGTHLTFAPKYSSGVLSSAPNPGTKVRLEYFQHPYVSAGHNIAGLYELIYDDSMFEKGIDGLLASLQPYRQWYLDAAVAAKNFFNNLFGSGNTPGVNPQNTSTNTANAQSMTSSLPIGPGSMNIVKNISQKNEEQKYDYFANFIPQNYGTFRSNITEKNVVSIRKETSTYANKNAGFYDDVFYMIWKDSSGKKRVTEYVGNTEPVMKYYKVFQPHLYRLKPGYMIYEIIKTTELDKRGNLKYNGTYLRMKSGIRGIVEGDLNDNGYFDDNNEKPGGTSMLFHPGGAGSGPNEFVGSAGCQTMPPKVFAKFVADLQSDGPINEIGYTLTQLNTLFDPEASQSIETTEPTTEAAEQNPPDE